MTKTIVSHPERCLACLTCVVECSISHAPGVESWSELFIADTQPQPRIFVTAHGDQCVPLQCFHCEEAACLDVCMSDAIYRSEANDSVVIDREKCSGCRQCLLVCPFGMIDTSNSTTGVIKCDGCGDRIESGLEPACVSSCPTHAITLEDVSVGDQFPSIQRYRPEVAAPRTQKLTRDEFVALAGARSLPAFLENAVTTFVIDVDRCKACGKCLKTCPVDGISGEKKVPHVIDEEMCIRCGQCEENCPFDSVDRVIDAEMDLVLCGTCGIPFTTLAEYELASSRDPHGGIEPNCPLCRRARTARRLCELEALA